jgi:hypothetical protein
VFEIGFAVEVDPEFPGDGGEAPQRIPPGLPRVGAVLSVTVPGMERWDIAVGAPGWWRTPDPSAIAFISDWRGYVVDVVTRRILLEIPGVTRIREDERHDLLLLATGSFLTAVAADGVAWQTEDLVYGDLKVVGLDAHGIICTGMVDDVLPSRIVLDPSTGRVLPEPISPA